MEMGSSRLGSDSSLKIGSSFYFFFPNPVY